MLGTDYTGSGLEMFLSCRKLLFNTQLIYIQYEFKWLSTEARKNPGYGIINVKLHSRHFLKEVLVVSFHNIILNKRQNKLIEAVY